jgi:hypothetical protein
VSSEQEIGLYRICARLGVTYITISHRPALMAFHDRMLAIGDGKKGWELSDIDRARHLKAFEEGLVLGEVPPHVEVRALEQSEARSAKYVEEAKLAKRVMPSHSFARRFAKVSVCLWLLPCPRVFGRLIIKDRRTL